MKLAPRQRAPSSFGVALGVTLLTSVSAAVAVTGCVVPAGPEKEISGEQLYRRHCARCHGDEGQGSALMPSARDLTNASYMATKNDEQLRRVIMGGKPPNMPAFGGQFGEPSMKVLVAYVRSLSEPSVAGATQPGGDTEPSAENEP